MCLMFWCSCLPQLTQYCYRLLDWAPESLQTNPPATLFFWHFNSFVFTLCRCTCFLKDLFLTLHSLSWTVSLAKLGHQTHCLSNNLWNFTSLGYPIACVCVCTHTYMCAVKVCFDCLASLCCNGFCGEIVHKRVLLLLIVIQWGQS